MNCDFVAIDEARVSYVCSRCGRVVLGASMPIYAACQRPSRQDATLQYAAVAHGPGAELKAIFSSLGIDKLEGCQCDAHVARMNAWGVAGCREHFGEIVTWLRDGQDQFGWRDKLKAAASAVKSGLLGELRATDKWSDLTGWADPFPAMVELAIRRAEAKSTTESSSSLSTRDE